MSDDLDRSSTISVMKYRLHARQCNTYSTPFPPFLTARWSGCTVITHMDDRGTVLVVDDDAVFLFDLRQILQSDGYTVVQAQTEADALECARTSRPDVVLIDVRLGDSSGIETLSRLRNILDDSVFVVMSAYADVESAIGAIQSGAHDFITKPFSEESVRLVVARCLEIATLGRAKAEADAEIWRRNEELAARNARLRALVETARRLTADPRDGKVEEQVLREFLLAMDADSGALYLRNGDVLALCCSVGVEAASPEVPLLPDRDSPFVGVLTRRRPERIGSDPSQSRWIAVPLISATDRIEGLFTLHRSSGEAFAEYDLDLGQIFTSLAAEVLESAQSYQRLNESEARLRTLVDKSSDLIIFVQADGSVIYASPSIASILGYEENDLIGRDMAEITHPDDMARALEALARFSTGEKVLGPSPTRVRHADGDWRLIEFAGAGRLTSSHVTEFVLVGRDVTEQVAAREAVDYRLRFEKLVSSLSTGFINLPVEAITEGIDHALEEMGLFFDVDRSYVFLFSDDLEKMSCVYEWCRQGITPQQESLQDLSYETMFPWFTAQIRKLNTVYIPDVDRMPPEAAAEQEEFRREGISSIVNVPMVVGGQLRGFVGFDAVARRRTFSDDIIAGLTLVGEIIASALLRREATVAFQTSELRYRSLFEKSSDALFLMGDGRFTDANSETCRMFRCTPDQLIGRPPTVVFPEKQPDGRDSATVAAEILARANSGEEQRFEWVHVRFDGTPFHSEVILTPIALPEGFRVLAIVRDVSERHAAEERLRQSEQRYRQLFERSPALSVVYAEDGRILDVNDALVRAFGIKAKERLIGRSMFDYLATSDAGAARQRLLAAASDEPAESAEWTVRVDDGSHRALFAPAGVQLRVEYDDGTVGTLVQLIDVTEQRAAEAREAEQREQLYQAAKLVSLGTLLSGVAHEINNPNNFIRMSVDNLAEFWSDAEEILRRVNETDEVTLGGLPYDRSSVMIRRMVEGIREGSQRISRLVNDLKDFVRQGDGTHRDHVDLNDILKSAINIVSSTVAKATANFGIHYSHRPVPIYCDRHQIEQVIMNLLTNAAQSLDSPDQTVDVEIKTYPRAQHVDLVVRDTGRGISDEDLRQITDPFFTTRRSEGGTGLGLAVSHRITADHGGTLQFASEVGSGTVVTLRLPLHTGHAANLEGEV